MSMVSVSDTPFVDRHGEISQLALENAYFIYRLQTRKRPPKVMQDWRGLNFVYAAQMYGAGKTRLGMEFIPSLTPLIAEGENGSLFQNCPGAHKPVFRQLVGILEQFAQNGVYQDYSLKNKDLKALVEQMAGIKLLGYQYGRWDFPKLLLNIIRSQRRPILFHFDEAGDLSVDQLRELRGGLEDMLQELEKEELEEYPPFFLISGRGTCFNELGIRGSHIGSHWLILEPLEVEHVTKIIKESSTTYPTPQSLVKFHQGLPEEKLTSLVSAIIEWTGGAPRPLLYTLALIDSLPENEFKAYQSEKDWNSLFRALLSFISTSEDLKRELGPVSDQGRASLPESDQRAYHELCFLSFQEKRVKEEFLMQGGKDARIYLRSLNVFIQRWPGEQIQIIVPGFVRELLRDGMVKELVSLFDRAYGDHEWMFEAVFLEIGHLQQSFSSGSVREGFFGLIPDEYLKTFPPVKIDKWEQRGPKVSKAGTLDPESFKDLVLDKGSQGYEGELAKTNLRAFVDHLPGGSAFCFGAKSSSADGLIKLSEGFVLEWQTKSGAQELKTVNLQKEVSKSIVNSPDVQKEVSESIVNSPVQYQSIFLLLVANANLQRDQIFLPGEMCHLAVKSFRIPGNLTFIIPSSKTIEQFLGPKLFKFFQTPKEKSKKVSLHPTSANVRKKGGKKKAEKPEKEPISD